MAKTQKKTTKKSSTKSSTSAATKKGPSKSEIQASLAESTGLTKKQVAQVFEGLEGLIQKNVSGRGPGQFVVPGLMKITVIKRPATKARLVRNPATGEMVMSKPKPARKVVKVRPLKKLKEMV